MGERVRESMRVWVWWVVSEVRVREEGVWVCVCEA